jgi:hypothetical protein
MRHYEDFIVGDVYRSEIGRTVTETDNLLFTILSLNTKKLGAKHERDTEILDGPVAIYASSTTTGV